MPGHGGGKLSNQLELLVIDVTVPGAPVTVYAGTLKRMGPTDVGALLPGQHRDYLFVATLRPGGPSDNAFQGAALTTGFTWSATGAAAPPPAPPRPRRPARRRPPRRRRPPPPRHRRRPPAGRPRHRPRRRAPAAPSQPVTGAGADPTGRILGAQLFGLPSAKACVSRRRFAIHVRRPSGVALRSIAVTVNGRTKLRLKGLRARKVKARVNLKGLPAGKVVVKITAVTTTGRKAVSTRTYKTCAAKKRKR